MDDIKALVATNQLGLPQDKVQSLQNMVARGSLSFLSPDKEGGPYLLYYLGDSLEAVAKKTSIPLDIIYLTAMRYKWAEKADSMRQETVVSGLGAVQQDIVQLLSVATYISLKKQVEDIIAGRADASSCALLPKNIHGLEKLINMINALKPEGEGNKATTNIQINLSGGSLPDVDVLDIPKSKLPPGVK